VADRVGDGDVEFFLSPSITQSEYDPETFRRIWPRCAAEKCGRILAREVVKHDGKLWHRGCVPKAEV
jgi:hypothetical protein